MHGQPNCVAEIISVRNEKKVILSFHFLHMNMEFNLKIGAVFEW